jgi:cytochrome c peroxidase
MSTSHWMNALAAVVVLAPVTFVATRGTDAARVDEISTTLTPEALNEIAQVEAEIDRIEAQTLERLAALPDNQVQQIELI